MSDAMTEIARDEQRGRFYGNYLEALREFLINHRDEDRIETINLAEKTDGVGRGYWGGQTSIESSTETTIFALQAGDKDVWARFLFSLKDKHHFQTFKALSPFADKLLVSVDYGSGFVTFHGEIELLMESIIRNGKGWKTYDTDKYVVALDNPNQDEAEVFWVSCGIGGVKGPREVKKQSS